MPYKEDCADNKGPSARSIESNEGNDWCPFIRYDVYWELLRGVCIKINWRYIPTVRYDLSRRRSCFDCSPFFCFLIPHIFFSFFFFLSHFPSVNRNKRSRSRDSRYESRTNFASRSMLFARALVRVSRSRLNGLTDLSIIKEALEKSPCTNTLYIFSSFDIVDRERRSYFLPPISRDNTRDWEININQDRLWNGNTKLGYGA